MLRLTTPLSPNASIGLAGLGVERVELAVARAEDDLRRRLRVARPVLDAARRRIARRQLERPVSPCRSSDRARRRGRMAWTMYMAPSTTSGVVSLEAKPRRPRVWLELVDAGPGSIGAGAAPAALARAALPAASRARPERGLGRGAASPASPGRRLHVVHPRHLQRGHVGRRDLVERREARAARIAVVGRPVAGRRRGSGVGRQGCGARWAMRTPLAAVVSASNTRAGDVRGISFLYDAAGAIIGAARGSRRSR